MKSKEKLIKAITAKWEQEAQDKLNLDALSKFIASELDKIENTKQELRRLGTQKAKIDQVHAEQSKEISEKVKQLQKDCNHLHSTYHPDPSGNNDSWTECNICGSETSRGRGWSTTGNLPHAIWFDGY